MKKSNAEQGDKPLIRLEGLSKIYSIGQGLSIRRSSTTVIAVNDVSLSIDKGELVGLVGESGCGKSTLGRLTIRLLEPTKGKIFFEDQDITKLHDAKLRAFRRNLQIVFQDPLASLNPRMTIHDLVAEPLRVHRLARGRARTERVIDLLSHVGLGREHLYRFPHEFSGGQRQRICIARALAPQPSFIVADEPLSALDVSVQAQIMNLLLTLNEELGLAFLFISHDLNVVGTMATRVAVMYLGKLVEVGKTEDLYKNPLHPYSKALLESVPSANFESTVKRPLLKGEAPSATSPPKGCTFHPRCPIREHRCTKQEPELIEVAPGRQARCLLLQEKG